MFVILLDNVVVGKHNTIDVTDGRIKVGKSLYLNHNFIETNNVVSIGDLYDGSSFIKPPTTDEELQDAKDAKCKVIDSQTQSDILNIASEPKQRNYLAKAIELEKKQRNGLTDEADDDQLIALESIWTSIETLVNDGNAKEQLVQDATNIEDIESI